MKINFIDVGCAGYMPEPWDRKSYGKYIDNIISFDIQNKELNYIFQEFSESKIYENVVFDEEYQKDFYMCKRNRVSSLFKPNRALLIPYLKLLNDIRDTKKYHISKYDIVDVKKVNCIRLDTILNDNNINFDFIKTDTEGADFQVIKSLGKYLETQIIGIHTELYHKEMYTGITLFDEVNSYLVENGFYKAKEFGGVNGYWNNFLYIREDDSKKDKINLIKKAYNII